ncbi:MAG: Ig-like domain-containing protein [Thermonemataceae bacterium]
MKSTKNCVSRRVYLLLLSLLLINFAGFAQSVHPGVYLTQAGLDKMKTICNNEPSHPMAQGYSIIKNDNVGKLSFTATPFKTVEAMASGKSTSEIKFREDAHAVYAHALQFVVSGNQAHADKAIEIAMAWANTFEDIVSVGYQYQKHLEAYWAVGVWVPGLDIIRYYNNGASGITQSQIEAIDGFLMKIYPYLHLNPQGGNNWASARCNAIVALGAYLGDEEIFQMGIDQYKDYILPQHVKADGYIEETGRDCTHMQYNIIVLNTICEMAWNQGIDLYGIKLGGQNTPRLLLGLEFAAKVWNGTSTALNCSGFFSHGAGGWEMGYNHFKHRLNLPCPNLETYVLERNRPSDYRSETHFTGWATATHGDLDKEGYATPPAVSLTSPADNTTFAANANINLTATATVSSGDVEEVEFFANDISIGKDLSAPWSFEWTGAAEGIYELEAVARTEAGGIGYSEVINIVVGEPKLPVLFLVGSTTLNAGDAAALDMIEALGYTVEVRTGAASSASDAVHKAAIVISSTLNSSDVGKRFKEVDVPVLLWEHYLFDDMGMTGTVEQTDFGFISETNIQITDQFHPVAGGLSGNIQVTNTSTSEEDMSWGVPSPEAAIIATLPSASEATIFAYNEGDNMGTIAAPARRIGLFLFDESAADLTADGKVLFENAIEWAINGVDNIIPVTGVSVSPATATVEVGEATQLTASVVPLNATSKAVTWNSADLSVATVDNTGRVTGVAPGSVAITVTTQEGDFSALATLQVVPSAVGDPNYVWHEAFDNGAASATDQTAYTVEDNSDGIFEVVDGHFLISGNGGENDAPFGTWTSEQLPIEGASASIAVSVGGDATGLESRPEAWADYLDVFYSIDGGDEVLIASHDGSFTTGDMTISESNITGGDYLQVIIKAKTTGNNEALYFDDVVVTVNDGTTSIPVESISVSPASITVEEGTTTQLTHTIAPTNATNKNINWLSDNTNVATVNASGLVQAQSPGVANITATTVDGQKTATSVVTVTESDVAPVCATCPTGTAWSQVWADEFDGNSLDLTKWTYGQEWDQHKCTFPNAPSVNGKTLAEVGGGKLTLYCQQTSHNGKNYAAGMVKTRAHGEAKDALFSFQYGYVEARIKYNLDGKGRHANFYTYGYSKVNGQASIGYHHWPPEIDIAEVISYGVNQDRYDQYHLDWHYKRDENGVRLKNEHTVSETWNHEWHVYGAEWHEDGFITFYRDGVKLWKTDVGNGGTEWDMAQYLLLRIGTGDAGWGGDPDQNTDANNWPATMEVDYVRVYQKNQANARANAVTENSAASNQDLAETLDNELKQLLVFPNPANDLITVRNLVSKDGVIRIYNTQGILVNISSFNTETTLQVDISQLPEGLYYLKVGQQSTKFIKQ